MTSGGLRTPTPNIPLKDAMDQMWGLATADQGDGTQAVKVAIASVVPAPVTAVNRSVALSAGVAATVMAANTARRYLFLQAQGQDIWVSFIGTAVASALGSFLVQAGQTYEINGIVPGQAVSVICASAVNLTAAEG